MLGGLAAAYRVMPAVQTLNLVLPERSRARRRKKFNPGADLVATVSKLIRSGMVVTPTRRDVGIHSLALIH
jgi:hypothetical protein